MEYKPLWILDIPMGKTHDQGQDFPIYTKPYTALNPPIHPQL